jgi:hypothetical protein
MFVPAITTCPLDPVIVDEGIIVTVPFAGDPSGDRNWPTTRRVVISNP